MLLKKYKILGKEVYRRFKSRRFKSYTICCGCSYNDNNGGCLYSNCCKAFRLSNKLEMFRYRPAY